MIRFIVNNNKPLRSICCRTTFTTRSQEKNLLPSRPSAVRVKRQPRYANSALSNYPVVISLISMLVTSLIAYITYSHQKTESEKTHQDYYVDRAVTHLRNHFQLPQDRVKDIPGLPFIPRDEHRIEELKEVMKSAGGLTLLEGPSGCGKTTAIQYTLRDLQCPGVYFSVRDNTSGLPPLGAFAQAFGIQDLPKEQVSNSLDIVRLALEKRKKQNGSESTPVLVIDDVQQLLKNPHAENGGKAILEWCLGRAANQELTILFVSSETVQDKLKQLSGYTARLSIPDVLYDYIPPEVLKPALMHISEKHRTFTSEEVDEVIEVVGTHMSDIRGIQRRRKERGLGVKQALVVIVQEEARVMKTTFQNKFLTLLKCTEKNERVLNLLGYLILPPFGNTLYRASDLPTLDFHQTEIKF